MIFRDDQNPQKITGVFIKSVSAILFFTAAIKILSFLIGNSKIFSISNPLFTMSTNRQVIGLSGLAEMLIVVILNIKISYEKKIFAIIILNSLFLSYKFSLLAIGYGGPCPCLGSFFDWLHISNLYANLILYLLIVYMLIGSYIILVLEFGFLPKIFADNSAKWRQRKKTSLPEIPK